MDMLVGIIVYDSTSTVNIKEESLITEGLFLNNSKTIVNAFVQWEIEYPTNAYSIVCSCVTYTMPCFMYIYILF